VDAGIKKPNTRERGDACSSWAPRDAYVNRLGAAFLFQLRLCQGHKNQPTSDSSVANKPPNPPTANRVLVGQITVRMLCLCKKSTVLSSNRCWVSRPPQLKGNIPRPLRASSLQIPHSPGSAAVGLGDSPCAFLLPADVARIDQAPPGNLAPAETGRCRFVLLAGRSTWSVRFFGIVRSRERPTDAAMPTTVGK